MSKKEKLLKVGLPILILLVCILITVVMVKTRSVPQKRATAFAGPLIEVMAASAGERQITVLGTGTVQARQEADITPQVSGKVETLAAQMVEGGFFKKGEMLFAIEAVDYRLALERAKASLAQAELELMRNESQAEIARLEWDRIESDSTKQANPLTLYEPQLKAAKAQVASARSMVEQAELDLARTKVYAPFNCYVRSEQVDIGQYLRAGTAVAKVAGTDEVEIVVPIPLEEQVWLQIPGESTQGAGSTAQVHMQLGEKRFEWSGRISRSLGEVDPQNRMAKVVVAVSDPFGGSVDGEDRTGLKPGMFVGVTLHGDVLDGVIAIPRQSLRDNDTVWTVTDDDRLKIEKVEIIRRERQEILIASGIEPGARVVLTGLAAAVDGMLLRPQMQENAQ
ncbi:MAG: efflux RND transporter periplasmic adaptor subunit [Desulfuromonas sp.]|nr:MAG: efflux RND transporter periplasmic adaptor subunit [Desulfuromonas sp.]